MSATSPSCGPSSARSLHRLCSTWRLATLAGILVFAIARLISLRELDRAALADRFFPHVSAAELRRTLAAADELRGTRRDEHDEDDDDE